MKGKYITLFAVAVIAVLGYLWLAPVGIKSRPDISVISVDGNVLSLKDYHGQPLLVTFWATSCPGCLREMPHLIELYEDLSPQGLEIIAVAMDYDPPSRVLAMRQARQIPYPIALDMQADAARAFGNVRLTPTSFLIAPDGRIIYSKIGELDMERLRSDILGLMKQAMRGAVCTQQQEAPACSG